MKIKFICDNPLIKDSYPPKPIASDIPDNFSKMTKNPSNVLSCMPVVDFINSGYIIYNTYEFRTTETVVNFQKGLTVKSANDRPEKIDIPSAYRPDRCPNHLKKGYFRIETEWKIVTPPGYSCFIMQPFYEEQTDYTLLPAIVDTDKHDYIIHAVGYTNKSSHRFLPGDKLLQVIPFKRDNWEMEIFDEPIISNIFYFLHGAYKNLFHSKKVFK